MPSIRQPSPTNTRCGDRRWSCAGRLNCAASAVSASAMPTALARPWPSGPVVVSTPGVMADIPDGRGSSSASWRKRLSSSIGRSIAGQVQQRVQQHRAVAVRQHEAVAVGPGRIGRVVLQIMAPQHRGDVGHAHRHARVAGIRLLDRVDREKTNARWPLRSKPRAIVLGQR